jgi:hypothetical protein
MPEPLKLYHGTNSAHEFWQDESANWIILRCHQETMWSIIRNRTLRLQKRDHFQHYGWADSVGGAVKMLPVRSELSTEYEYQKIGDKFTLVAPVSLEPA